MSMCLLVVGKVSTDIYERNFFSSFATVTLIFLFLKEISHDSSSDLNFHLSSEID